jgi:glycosyltransferase involved in cell wall biosynthesis
MLRERPAVCRKVLVCVTEDWFTLSHFRPLLHVLMGLAEEVVVATRSSGRIGEIEALGCRVVNFDFQRSSLDPIGQIRTVIRLAHLVRKEAPDVVHAVAMQMLTVTAIALSLARAPRTMFHLTGLGYIGISDTPAARLLRPLALATIGRALRRETTWLLAENPEDLAYMVAAGADPGPRHTILGGAGIDPDEFAELPPPDNAIPVAAYVGRMIRAKGVDVLVEAQRRLARGGTRLALGLYGRIDPSASDAVPREELESWGREPDVTWFGHVDDVREVWRRSDIAVMPSITREGMPRSVLEAAASGRPLIVTDVPGCRHFVRHGIEGLIVPPSDPDALAEALGTLTRDAELRQRMGAAARQRVVSGFTSAQVEAGIRDAYQQLLVTGVREPA